MHKVEALLLRIQAWEEDFNTGHFILKLVMIC